MRARFLNVRFLALLLAAALVAPPAVAQVVVPPDNKATPIEPPKELPKPPRGDPSRNIEFLFEALKVAPDEASAKHIEERIWALWVISNSDTANLLMTRVKTAVDGKDTDLAVKLLDAIIELKPDYVEAWNRRATLYYMKKDFGRALADIQQVLMREPRHFGALSGLGMIMQEFGDEKRALDAFRMALAIHPKLAKIPELVKNLTEKVEGRDI